MSPRPRRGSLLLRFGVFEVDLRKGELRRSGLRQKLGPQPFEVLRALLERPGEVITRDELQKRLWPENTFVDYELGLKKCVNRIREVLGDSGDNPRFIETLRGRGYRFIAPVEQVAEFGVGTDAAPSERSIPDAELHDRRAQDRTEREVPAEAGVPTQSVSAPGYGKFRQIVMVGVSILLIVVISGFLLRKHDTSNGPAAEPVVLPLLSLPGEQSMAAFSPDGSRLAFYWRAPAPKDSGIYAVVVGTQSLLRLTQDVNDYAPVWSPDGREVAFLRNKADKFLVELVPALGGPEKTIYSGRVPWQLTTQDVGLSFSPDGKLLAFSEWTAARQSGSIELLSRRDLSTRFVTLPPASFYDRCPSFSPGGDKIAFLRSSGPDEVDELFVVSKEGGKLKQLTFDHKRIFGPPVWTSDGRYIVFSSSRAGLATIWRMPASGGIPQRVPAAGPIAYRPALSASGNQLAYQHVDEEQDLWRIELEDATHARGPASILVPSAKAFNFVPQFSPDGLNLAFQTGRSGYSEIWCAEATVRISYKRLRWKVPPERRAGRRMDAISRLIFALASTVKFTSSI